MKKLLLLVSLTLLTLSCSTEERLGDTVCNCIEVEEYTTALSYGEALQSTWTLTGRLQPTDFECEQNGYVYMPHVSTENYNYEYTGLYFYKRWRVKCE